MKKFAGQAGIPYRLLIGSPEVLAQIPNFKAFPTSIVLDRSGKVRVLITENEKGSAQLIADSIEALLAEKSPAAAGATPKKQR